MYVTMVLSMVKLVACIGSVVVRAVTDDLNVLVASAGEELAVTGSCVCDDEVGGRQFCRCNYQEER
jgi:hypothetical protein